MKRGDQHKRLARWRWLLIPLNVYHGGVAAWWALRILYGGEWWWLALLNTFAFYLFAPLLLTVPLALALRSKRTALVAALLLVGGMIRFAPVNIIADNSIEREDLRVVTHNLLWTNQRFDEAVDSLMTLDADIIALQEIIAEHYDPRLQRLYETYPHHTYVQGSVRLFSRHPFIESGILYLEPSTFAPDLRRQVIRAVVDVDGQPVTVYAVHLSLPMGDEWHLPVEVPQFPFPLLLRYDETRRNGQIRSLLAAVAAESHPVLVMGDFNMSYSSLIYNEFADVGLRDSFADAGRGWGMSWKPHPALPVPPLLRIDYIWHTPDLHVLRYRQGDFNGSDHRPQIADFTIDAP